MTTMASRTSANMGRPYEKEALPPQVVVGVIEPVLPDGAEDVELECVFERFGLVLDARGNVQHLALTERDLHAADEKLQRALQHISHLFALVRMHRHEAAALQIDLR